MPPEDQIRIRHLSEAATKAIAFTNGRTRFLPRVLRPEGRSSRP
jgi:hypothetical protein